MNRLLRIVMIAMIPQLPFAIEPSHGDQLLCVKRVYVDMLDGDDGALQMRNMLISALQQSHLFIVTENEERADAVLHGSAKDQVYNESHSSSEGVNAHVQASTGNSAYRGGSANKSVGGSLGETESSHSVERKHETTAAIRLVNMDGDVIWSTTQESQGSKFKGSMADVADKVTRKLADDLAKARAARPPAKPAR